MSINSFLLSIFGKNKQFEVGVNSLAIHYQILSIFYIGFAVTFAICLFEAICCNSLISVFSYPLSAMSITGFILSLSFLKKGHRNAAGTLIIISLHAINLTTGLVLNLPLGALMASFSSQNYSYFLTDSNKLVIFNNAITAIEFFIYIKRILEIFHVTLSDEQHAQITAAILVFVFVFMIISLLSYFQKNIERNLWRLLNENYKKSEDLTKEVVHAMNAKDSFISSLSHEVRNVLNSLNGSVYFLLSALKDSPHLDILKNAKMSGEILLNLVTNALDAAKIRADKLELSYDHASFEDIVKKVFTINSENLKNKNIKARAFIDSQVPKELWIDSGRVLQIMMNLMSNALKFTPREGQIRIDVFWCKKGQEDQSLLDPFGGEAQCYSAETPQNLHPLSRSIEDAGGSVLEFSFEEERIRHRNLTKLNDFDLFESRRSRRSTSTLLCHSDNWQIRMITNSDSSPPTPLLISQNERNNSGFLKVQVCDTGCGIAKENLPKLFEMYIQADHTVSSNYGGTGLGLWICKQLCHKMQGDINVYSELNVGTKFVFYIPVNNNNNNLRNNSQEINLRNHKVNTLVVDDHEFNRDLHKLLLEREGAQVTLAQNGKEAIQKFQEKGEGHFDFIFMDLNMPIMDGFAATREIRKWEVENKRKRIMIYFVSGEYFNDNEVVEALKKTAGFSNTTTGIKFLRKPIEVEMVAKIVNEHKKLSQINPTEN